MAHDMAHLGHDQQGKETKKDVLFINYDANHRSTTRSDRKVINTHVSKRSHGNQKNENRLFIKASDTLQSYLWGRHIGGFRAELFDILPIENKGFVAEAFDHCEQYESSVEFSTDDVRYSDLCASCSADW